ncbi:hypothetical protein AMECASPLE_034853 [Ameca splendens]|uniref:Uncharacterized protein n=1 Tax=Ameca splendens TaxID=208324 RepID=A0ABV0Z6W5_9TELE
MTYFTDDDDPTSTTMAENQTSGQSRGTSVLCETQVAVYQHSSRELNAPKKSPYYLCKVQRPLLDTQQEEWSLEPYELCGVWGYIFKYEKESSACINWISTRNNPAP